MAVNSAVYPPEMWAIESLIVLQNTHVMPPLVHRNFSDEVADRGDTIHTRKPGRFTVGDIANSAGATITPSATSATDVAIDLDQHKHVTFTISNRDMRTAIKNLVTEFVEPGMIDIAEQVDGDLLGTSGLTSSSIASVNLGTSTLTKTDIINVRKQLRTQQCPLRTSDGGAAVNLVMGVEHEAQALDIDLIASADTTGDAQPAIRTGYHTTKYGLNFYADQTVPTGSDSTQDQSVAFHKNSLAFVSRPLDIPDAEAMGIRNAPVEKDGVTMQATMSFQHLSPAMSWVVSLHLLYGFQLLDANLAVVLKD